MTQNSLEIFLIIIVFWNNIFFRGGEVLTFKVILDIKLNLFHVMLLLQYTSVLHVSWDWGRWIGHVQVCLSAQPASLKTGQGQYHLLYQSVLLHVKKLAFSSLVPFLNNRILVDPQLSFQDLLLTLKINFVFIDLKITSCKGWSKLGEDFSG